MGRSVASVIALVLLLAACSGSGGSPSTTGALVTMPPTTELAGTATITSPSSPEPVPAPTSTTTALSPEPTEAVPATTVPATTTTIRTVDLSDRPLIWFGPLPPLPVDAGRPFTGADDFFDLFAPDAAWARAAGHADVFLLYAEWVGWNATPRQLETVVSALDRLGLALAVEGSPLTRPDDCGTGVESWGGIPEGTTVAAKVQAAGGTIDLWAMDAPLAYAHVIGGAGACRWSQERVAAEIGEFTRTMLEYFPEIVVGDTEPLWRESTSVELYEGWLDTFERVNGYGLPFLHLDVDWGRPGWGAAARELERVASARGVDFGIFYIGNWDDLSDRTWISIAGERAKAFERGAGGDPDHVLFQSWHDHPDRSLPESEPWTFTNLINTYVERPEDLGVLTDGPGANLAFGKPAIGSASLGGLEPGAAVDGDSTTWWGAGAPAPQWIEIDLGSPEPVREIRLRVGQSPDGATVHRVFAGPDAGHLTIVHTFDGVTRDLQELVFVPDDALEISVLRVETTDSPSWVSWREIEVIAAG